MAKVVEPDALSGDKKWVSNFMRGYPWVQWFDGQVWELTQGEDFDEPMPEFRRRCYSVAKTYFYASVVTRTKGTKMYVQLLPIPEKPARQGG